MKIVTADGRIVEDAYLNAWSAEPELEGVRLVISIGHDGAVASVLPEDAEAVARIGEDELDIVLRRAATMAMAGDVDMCDDREVEAWII